MRTGQIDACFQNEEKTMSKYNLKESLRSYFGFDKFKGSQEERLLRIFFKSRTPL